MSRQTESGTIVEFWDTPYVPKYGGNAAEPQQLSLVDQELIYNGLEKLVIKAAGDTTGVQTSDIFSAIERPDYNQPFPDIVSICRSENAHLKVSYEETSTRTCNFSFISE